MRNTTTTIVTGVLAAMLVAALPVAAQEPPPVEEPPPIYQLVFPVVGEVHYTDTFGAPRSGGRTHAGIDILADKLTPVVAAADGTIGWMDAEQGGDCCAMALEHDDGWSSWYIHLNNDTPGTDDGLGWGFAEGITTGVHVDAGELIGYVGDSGNAEDTVSHLHFELHDPDRVPVNPYPHLLEAAVINAPGAPLSPCPDGASCDTVALVDRESRFALHDGLSRTARVETFFYGKPGDVALMGDWDCDGIATPAMYRPSNGFMYLRNTNDFGVADVEYFYGRASDIPLAGDFDGDGCDTLAIYRPDEARVYVKNTLGTGTAEYSFYFGKPGDKPFAGDFDGDGTDTVGLHRESTGYVYFRNTNDEGVADFDFFYGEPNDQITAGDWDGDGIDTVAVYRPKDKTLYLKNANELGNADFEIEVGDVRRVLAACLVAAPSPGSDPLPPPDEGGGQPPPPPPAD